MNRSKVKDVNRHEEGTMYGDLARSHHAESVAAMEGQP